jgi:MFS transporter, UMF1 family
MSESEGFQTVELAPKKEIFSWAMFDFANSGYSTVVATAIYNAYFVSTVAGGPGGYAPGVATLLWTITIAISNAIIVITAPILGCIADYSGAKKKFLVITAVGCSIFTAMLGYVGPGMVPLAMGLMVLANVLYGSGENLIAAFLPEIAPKDMMGRVSAFGWTIGYTGGLLTLGLCLAYVSWAQHHGLGAPQYVPITMLIVSFISLIMHKVPQSKPL